MSNDPEEIRREIARTRSELSDNVNLLGEKVNPSSIAKRQTARVKDAAVSVKEALMGSASDASETGNRALGAVGYTMSNVGDSVSSAPSAVARKAQGSPLAAGLIAFGAGLLVSSLLPASKVEQDAAQKVKETAEPVVTELTGAAKEVAGNLQEPATQAVDQIKSTATDAVQTVKDEGTSAVGDVKDHAAQAKDEVKSAAN